MEEGGKEERWRWIEKVGLLLKRHFLGWFLRMFFGSF
jgi:hypothetical protein